MRLRNPEQGSADLCVHAWKSEWVCVYVCVRKRKRRNETILQKNFIKHFDRTDYISLLISHFDLCVYLNMENSKEWKDCRAENNHHITSVHYLFGQNANKLWKQCFPVVRLFLMQLLVQLKTCWNLTLSHPHKQLTSLEIHIVSCCLVPSVTSAVLMLLREKERKRDN